MGNTPTYGWPYPALADAPNGPSQIQALATAAENTVVANALIKPKSVAQPTQTGFGAIAAAGTLVIASMSIPDPGYQYQVMVWGSLLGVPNAAGNELVGQVNLDNAGFLATGAGNAPNAATLCWGSRNGVVQDQMNMAPGYSGTLSGAHTLTYIVKNNSGANAYTVYQGYAYTFKAVILPV